MATRGAQQALVPGRVVMARHRASGLSHLMGFLGVHAMHDRALCATRRMRSWPRAARSRRWCPGAWSWCGTARAACRT